jgi:hypothetical protein
MEVAVLGIGEGDRLREEWSGLGRGRLPGIKPRAPKGSQPFLISRKPSPNDDDEGRQVTVYGSRRRLERFRRV